MHVHLDRIIRKPFRHDDKFMHGPSILEAKCIRAALPVLARYTCTRLGEICALQASDVKQIEGLATLEINEEGRRRLNTSNAARDPFAQRDFTPLLSGFRQNYIKRCGEGFRLFPEIGSASGHLSDLFSKRFARFLHLLGHTDKRLVFDCFRHWCKQSLENNEVPAEILDQLPGWSRAQNGSAICGAECKSR